MSKHDGIFWKRCNGAGHRALLGRLRLPPRLAPGIDAIPLAKIAGKESPAACQARAQARQDLDEATLHSLRITLKRARYAAELSVPRGKRGLRFLADAKASGQDLLGEHQDGAMAEQQLRVATVLDSSTGAAFVAGRLAERRRAHRMTVSERLPEAWKRLRRSGARLR